MKTKPAVQMPDMDAVKTEAEREAKDATASLALVKKASIRTQDEYRWGANALAEVKKEWKKRDAMRRTAVDPLAGVIKTINAWFKPSLTALEEAEELLKAKMVEAASRFEEERARLIEEAGKKKNHAMADAIIEEAEKQETPKVDGFVARVDWVGEVTDASLIPREFLVPDVKALAAVTKAKRGDPGIPGWSARPRTVLAVSAEKVVGSGS